MMKAGFTGFIERGADYFKVIKTYADIGYTVLEGGDAMYRVGDGNVQENLKRVRDMGYDTIFTIGTNVQFDNQPNAKELIERAHTVGVEHVTIYHSGVTSWRFADREMPTYDEAMLEIDKMDKLAKELKKEGLSLVFHNHDQEFITTFNGVPLFWHMALKAEDLKFEIDLAWAHYAKFDPAQLIDQLGDRVAALHFKDYKLGDNFEDKPARRVIVPRYTTPGTGLVDIDACVQAADKHGVRYCIIEQDMPYHLTREDSVRTAYYIMKETGLVE